MIIQFSVKLLVVEICRKINISFFLLFFGNIFLSVVLCFNEVPYLVE